MSAPKAETSYPAWYVLVRATICFVVGIALILHEAFGLDPPGIISIVVGLTLMGFAPADFMTFLNGHK